jgi:hypothetical protein
MYFLPTVQLIYWLSTTEPQILNTPATSQDDFRAALIQRDVTCVVTGDVGEGCDASHCLPHAKVDEVSLSFDFDPPPSQIFIHALAVGNQLL